MPTKTRHPPPPIRACLFDMDGLLIDSEDMYSICTNLILQEYGRPPLPWSIKARLQGRPGPEAGRIFQQWAQLPIDRTEFQRKTQALQAQHFPNCRPLPGVETLLQTLSSRTEPRVELALATSSHAANFKLKTAHQEDLFSVFAPEHRVLGDDPRIAPGRGKPAPDIYLLALETVNARVRLEGEREVLPSEALVFEDSVPGVEAGRRAGMQVVWCPHAGLLEEMEGKEERVLAGRMGEHSEEGRTGEVGDGWARLLHTLEGFPYSEYGMHV
ncbi:hypothetical protein LTR62_000596 [Meristemomyces frigidus]|uniref:HAD superfamily hydrolase n=1 Tax=Meristemomyces frigidus TaxID=1508187 RepID=A0AAN7TA16_9PEZI|nr:hypothetical protein LTR62_000596 [Meristemomyces frigidus]